MERLIQCVLGVALFGPAVMWTVILLYLLAAEFRAAVRCLLRPSHGCGVVHASWLRPINSTGS